ncbi:MAG: hypothetical protein DRO09_00450 [Thermoprotei archaeon]|nr:MAG: hypothetical protein DRO09_00450 [Thermoprotei archaeon]
MSYERIVAAIHRLAEALDGHDMIEVFHRFLKFFPAVILDGDEVYVGIIYNGEPKRVRIGRDENMKFKYEPPS